MSHSECISFPDHFDQNLDTEQSPYVASSIVDSLPDIREKIILNPTEKVVQIGSVPYAIDLADEARTVSSLIENGHDLESYWQFFRDQAKYYAHESYGKNPAARYGFSLVRDGNDLRIWIDSMGKSLQSALDDAVAKGGPEWYSKRTIRERNACRPLEQMIQDDPARTVMEISPAPTEDEVSDQMLQDTSFDRNLSFVRFHRVAYDVKTGVPYLQSLAFKTNLSREKLAHFFAVKTGKVTPPEELLGTFAHTFESAVDLHDPRFAFGLDTELKQYADEGGLEPLVDDNEELDQHIQSTQYLLRQSFQALTEGVKGDVFGLPRAVHYFREFEKQLKARKDGTFQQVVSVALKQGYSQEEASLHAAYIISHQTYKAPENSCGFGVGASDVEISSGGGFSFESSTRVMSGGGAIYGGLMSSNELSVLLSNKKEECITCPKCGNPKGNKKIKGKWVCGSRSCPTNTGFKD